MTKSNDLEVCAKCGWYDGFNHHRHNDCKPAAGKRADELIACVGRPATKLGYGTGLVTIYTHEPRSETDIPPHIQFEVGTGAKPFRIATGGVWSLASFTLDEATAIVLALFASPFGTAEK